LKKILLDGHTLSALAHGTEGHKENKNIKKYAYGAMRLLLMNNILVCQFWEYKATASVQRTVQYTVL
jgi:hypothetical protein